MATHPFRPGGFGRERLSEQLHRPYAIHRTIAMLTEPAGAHENRGIQSSGNHLLGVERSRIGRGEQRRPQAMPWRLLMPSL